MSLSNLNLWRSTGLSMLLVFLLSGCSDGPSSDDSSNASSAKDQGNAGTAAAIKVVCTTGMIGDMVSRVGGDRVAVTALMGPGVDPHYYKASQSDIARLGQADLIVYNGLFLEGKMQDIFTKMASRKQIAVAAAGLPPQRLRRVGHDEHDPHVWFDVSLWALTLDNIIAGLSAVDPQGQETFEKNAALYRAELEQLHQWVQAEINKIPAQHRVLVTAHDAFGYFGLAYGIEVVGLQGISTVAEYGVNDVSNLVETIVSRGIGAIFVESSVSERSIQAVQQGCLARGFEVKIGGTLYSDAMGATGSGADTYIGMVRSNVNSIVTALQ
jgi:manganese/zinc/iron transport system substrate-binding protein